MKLKTSLIGISLSVFTVFITSNVKAEIFGTNTIQLAQAISNDVLESMPPEMRDAMRQKMLAAEKSSRPSARPSSDGDGRPSMGRVSTPPEVAAPRTPPPPPPAYIEGNREPTYSRPSRPSRPTNSGRGGESGGGGSGGEGGGSFDFGIFAGLVDSPLSLDAIKDIMVGRLALQRNERLAIGGVSEMDNETAVVELTTVGGSLIQLIAVDRFNANMWPAPSDYVPPITESNNTFYQYLKSLEETVLSDDLFEEDPDDLSTDSKTQDTTTEDVSFAPKQNPMEAESLASDKLKAPAE